MTVAPAQALVSGKTFVADCIEAVEPIQRAECRGYLAAVADALNSNLAKGQRVCVPPGTAQDEMYEAVKVWLRANAKLLQRMQGFGLVATALIKTYPCRR